MRLPRYTSLFLLAATVAGAAQAQGAGAAGTQGPTPPTGQGPGTAVAQDPAAPRAQGSGAPRTGNWQYPDTRAALRPSRFGLSAGGGLGMIRAASPYTLRSGEFAAGFGVINYDRNPGDLDVVEGMFQFALGVGSRFEVFARTSPLVRTNSVGQDPLHWPVPPLDLFVDVYPSPATRVEPYFLLAQEFPYKTYPYWSTNIDPPGNGAFSSSGGDLVLGTKLNVFSEDRGDWGGVGVRTYVEIPTETPGYNTYGKHRHRAGAAGRTDFGVDLLLAKVVRDAEVLVNVGYKRVGDPRRGLRVQLVDSGATDPGEFLVGAPVENILDLRDEASLHLGVTFPLLRFPRDKGELWFVGELSYTRHVGGGTPMERLVHPLEMRLGVQHNLPWARSLAIGFAWQLLFNDAGDGDHRTTSFSTPDGRGDINFGELVDPEFAFLVQEWFRQRGATFSHGSAKVFATDNPAFDSWRNISTEPQTVVGQGGGAALFYLTWRIAQAP